MGLFIGIEERGILPPNSSISFADMLKLKGLFPFETGIFR